MKIFVVDKYVIMTVCIALLASVFVVSLAGVNAVPTGAQNETSLPIYAVETEDKVVALTLNAAWNDTDIDQILETLRQNNIKCTFFAVGTWVEKYPEAVKKILADGHEMGNHSYNHAHYNTLDIEKMCADMDACDKLLKAHGADSKLFRAPYGEYNEKVVEACEKTGRYCIQWDVDSLDWKGLSETEMTERILQRIHNGSIILLHNGTEQTADALPGIIKEIRAAGYEFKTVGELIYKDNYRIDHAGRQWKKENQPDESSSR